MSVFKEINYSENNREIDRPDKNLRDNQGNPFSDSLYNSDNSDDFEAAFKKFGLTVDTSEQKASDTNDSSENKDYSDYLEQGANDSKYYDKETGKAYDSMEAWVKSQETLVNRYDGTAQYWERKAKKEYARFKNAEANGEFDAEKWEHYRRSQEYYAKDKDCKEKAEKLRAKLEKANDTSSESKQSDT